MQKDRRNFSNKRGQGDYLKGFIFRKTAFHSKTVLTKLNRYNLGLGYYLKFYPRTFNCFYKKTNKLIYTTQSSHLLSPSLIDKHIIIDQDIVKEDLHISGRSKMIYQKTLKLPQHLHIDTRECIEQLQIYRDASIEFLENTDIGIAIYHRFDSIWWQLLLFNMLYML